MNLYRVQVEYEIDCDVEHCVSTEKNKLWWFPGGVVTFPDFWGWRHMDGMNVCPRHTIKIEGETK